MLRNTKVNIIKKDKEPKILIVTPLLPEHKISKVTKKTIKRNNVPLVWVSYSSKANTAKNAQLGFEAYREKYSLPSYFLLLDNDIELGRHMLDRMVATIEKSPDHVAYCYCTFRFTGAVNKEFQAIPFDVNLLVQQNYISSNSLIKVGHLEFIGGLVTDQKYKRLLDWCTWLKFLQNGYGGIPCPQARFVAYASEDSISAGSDQEYTEKHQRVQEDFVKPFLDSIGSQKN